MVSPKKRAGRNPFRQVLREVVCEQYLLKLKQLKWCILGGDKRDAHFAHSLLKCDYDVKVCGVPQIDELPGRAMVNDLEDAVKDADVLVCPVTVPTRKVSSEVNCPHRPYSGPFKNLKTQGPCHRHSQRGGQQSSSACRGTRR